MAEVLCPLCVEGMDSTDLATDLCNCNFKVCLYCYNRICEEDGAQARCPNCRSVYDQERIRQQRPDPKQLEEIDRQRRQSSDRRRSVSTTKPRKELANMRVVQRNLVYVVGLALDICYEDVLKGLDYFGQYGKIVKISVSRGGPYGTASAKHGPTGSAYVTYRSPEDARRCIEQVHGREWDGKPIKACYGTTKYCNAFLKGTVCNNSDCLYLHGEAADEDSYTKEQTKSTKFVNLVHAASLNTTAAKAAAAAAAAAQALRPSSGSLPIHASGSQSSFNGTAGEGLGSALSSSPAHGSAWAPAPGSGGTTWAAVAQTPVPSAAALAAPPPPSLDTTGEEWPELPGASSASNGHALGISDKGLQSLTRNGSTMAAQLAAARANGSSGSHKPAAANGSADASASKQARLVPLTASRARKPSFDASSSSQAEDPSPPATTPLKGSPVSTTSSAEGVPAIPDSPLQKEPLQQVLENGHGSAAHLLPVSSAEGVEGSQPPAVAVPAAEAPRPGKGGPPPGFGAPGASLAPISLGPAPGAAPQPALAAAFSPSAANALSNGRSPSLWATSSPTPPGSTSVWSAFLPGDALGTPPPRARSRFSFAHADLPADAAPQQQGPAGALAGADVSLLSQRLQELGVQAARVQQQPQQQQQQQPATEGGASPGLMLLRQLQTGTGGSYLQPGGSQHAGWLGSASLSRELESRSHSLTGGLGAQQQLAAYGSAPVSRSGPLYEVRGGQSDAGPWEAQVQGQQWQLGEHFKLPAAL